MMNDLTPITSALAELKTAAGGFSETRSAVTGLENRFNEMETRIEYAISRANGAASNRAAAGRPGPTPLSRLARR